MTRRGTLHIVKEGTTPDGHGRYRTALTVGDNPAEIESPQREVHGEQQVMQFLQRLLSLPADEVTFYIDELLANGRVRVENVDEDTYQNFGRAA